MRDVEGIRVFPPEGNEVTITLPRKLTYAVFGPDGKSIYAADGMIVKVEFQPMRIVPIAGTEDLAGQIAASSDESTLVVSGSHGTGTARSCGVFKVTLPTGTVQQVLTASECGYLSSWAHPSVSPDGERLLAEHNHRWELVTLSNSATQFLNDKTWMAVWSPDGKWIATLRDLKHTKLVLLDATDISRTRELGSADGGLYWSPDSRFLLLYKDQLTCGLKETYSIQILDLDTGRRRIPRSAHCAIWGGLGGWVSNEIVSAH
jgi:Tol biopolymer transport system component